tara:strand:+ start:2178 stop:3077 length:900 start_codon:yes stop_codon:yes gene_type:complete
MKVDTYIPNDSELSQYFEEISQYDLLSRKEEEELFIKMHKWSNNMAKCGQRTRINGKAAREKLINSNLRLVVKIAKDYQDMGLPLSDLIAEGNVGLMKAVEKFKAGKGAKLSTYSSYWIKQCMFRAFDNKSRLVRVPSDAARKYPKILSWIEEYKRLSGEEPSLAEISKKFKTTEDRVLCIMQAKSGTYSLDFKIDEDGDGVKTFGEVIPDDKIDANESVEIKDNKEVLMKAISRLGSREQQIVLNRFGLDNNDFHTLEEIGKKFKVSRERIRQIESKALRKLRMYVRKEYQLDVCESF